jgi:2-haloacid dehalogenase
MLETLAFDLYGTLVDPLHIAQQLERSLGSAAQRTAELWRMKQLEYTFRLTAGDAALRGPLSG